MFACFLQGPPGLCAPPCQAQAHDQAPRDPSLPGPPPGPPKQKGKIVVAVNCLRSALEHREVTPAAAEASFHVFVQICLLRFVYSDLFVQNRLLRFVCSDSFVQICWLIFVCSDSCVGICLRSVAQIGLIRYRHSDIQTFRRSLACCSARSSPKRVLRHWCRDTLCRPRKGTRSRSHARRSLSGLGSSSLRRRAINQPSNPSTASNQQSNAATWKPLATNKAKYKPTGGAGNGEDRR